MTVWKITTTDIGTITWKAGLFGDVSLRGLLSMCGDLFGTQRLASIDAGTGLGTILAYLPLGSQLRRQFGPELQLAL